MRKALNAPKDRQSRVVIGLKKLRANRMKIAELMTTRAHSQWVPHSSIVLLGSLTMFGLIVPAVHERVHEDAQQEEPAKKPIFSEEMSAALE